MAHVARRYYHGGRSKSEIADELFLSRFKVARLLDAARRTGVVQITIDVPGDVNDNLSRELEEAYQLRRAVVIDDGAEDQLLARLGEAAVVLLSEVVREGELVGITSARTMLAIHELPQVPLPLCTFVQITGELPRTDASNVISLIRILTRRTGGSAQVFFAPMVASSEDAWRSYMAQPEVRAAFARFRELSVLITGVGAWAPGRSIIYDHLPDVRDDATRAGAVAEALGIPIDAHGRTVHGPARRRIVAPDVETLMGTRERIAVVFDPARADAVRVAARNGVINSIVTQRSNAEALLA
ncbi:sugar-binding transcriptional regulator [Beutenbergia cavernae]|nr:sugar-binding domain-containing protein [Beutenbergia cavernae]